MRRYDAISMIYYFIIIVSTFLGFGFSDRSDYSAKEIPIDKLFRCNEWRNGSETKMYPIVKLQKLFHPDSLVLDIEYTVPTSNQDLGVRKSAVSIVQIRSSRQKQRQGSSSSKRFALAVFAIEIPLVPVCSSVPSSWSSAKHNFTIQSVFDARTKTCLYTIFQSFTLLKRYKSIAKSFQVQLYLTPLNFERRYYKSVSATLSATRQKKSTNKIQIKNSPMDEDESDTMMVDLENSSNNRKLVLLGDDAAVFGEEMKLKHFNMLHDIAKSQPHRILLPNRGKTPKNRNHVDLKSSLEISSSISSSSMQSENAIEDDNTDNPIEFPKMSYIVNASVSCINAKFSMKE